MGNDGGSLPTRNELVNEPPKTRPLDIDLKRSLKQSEITQCSITGDPLSPPIASCGLGRLYNKATILQMLLDRSSVPEAPSHIQSLKDVVDVHVDQDNDKKVLWVCPITRHEMSSAYQFAYIVPCGHAFEYSAVKEFGEKNCFQCNTPYEQENIIPINPNPEQIQSLSKRLLTLTKSGKSHSLRKSSKKHKNPDKKRKHLKESEEVPSLTFVDSESSPKKKIKSDIEGNPKSESSTKERIKV
ncbi:replication termination factor Rtf2 [Schizosaccharomyces cryophilus OY26]|uniref:Replication termination factor Rtf2 n=1 Tax=Schizosaccharomyces cryophilus (strain OY26 / ATCC MYA-4695 / CBS 11777 / NBRC 106824 / NRRL Y48691) TaxID=653667 RepID=S9W2D0_SCHCR|nr:replication termination factor Rtf2 [Schizosaccharomyces cryophilus OY26]EPY54193.1 replication termination factor Rtf2 [Schizosaccharomyces cryophilus OY26]